MHNRFRLHFVPENVQRYSWVLWNSFRIAHTDIEHYLPRSESACVPRLMQLCKSRCFMSGFQMNTVDLVSLATQLSQGNWLILWNCRVHSTVHFSSPLCHTHKHTQKQACPNAIQAVGKLKTNFCPISTQWNGGCGNLAKRQRTKPGSIYSLILLCFVYLLTVAQTCIPISTAFPLYY